MKTLIGHRNSKLWCLLALAALAAPLTGKAGTDMSKAPPPVAPAPEDPFLTGNLTINYETHFISNGLDVWGVGTSWSQWFIHPSLELDFNLTKDLQFYVNTWWDVNGQIPGTIGKYIQEVDVNAGFYYTWDKLKFQLGYGAWNYNHGTEGVIDGKVSYTDPYGLNPFVALHARVTPGGSGFDNGFLAQVGFAPSKTWGAFTLALPVTVDFDTTRDYAGGSAGFGYVSVGLSASYALTKHVALNLGVTYYHTDSSVFPTNPKDDFVTGLAGFTISF
jgi:hypothetical protein